MTGVRSRAGAAAWVLCATTFALVLAQAALLVVDGVPLVSAEANDSGFPLIALAIGVGAVVGAAIVARHPRHRIGWLLCVGQAGAAAGLAAHALGAAVLSGAVGLPAAVGQLGLWVAHLLGAPYALACLGLLLALVPDGALVSRRWMPVPVLLIGGLALTAVGLLAVAPGKLRTDGSSDVGVLPTLLEAGGQLAIGAGVVAAAASLVVRRYRSTGVERQQLRWIGAAAGLLAVSLVLLITDNLARGGNVEAVWYLSVLFYLGYLAVPVATGLAVLRHRLYDIDAILGRTAWLVVLAVFVTGGYVAAVVAIGTVVGGSSHALWPSLLAYVAVALAFQPLRRSVDRIADRVAYGRRAGPYESLAALTRQLGDSGVTDAEVVALVARSTGVALGARAASATVSVPGGTDLTASWPDAPVPTWDTQADVSGHGRTAGTIRLALRPGHRLTRGQRRVLGEFARHAGLAFEAIALTAALRERADALARQRAELAASRRRLVTAADLERERLATAIRDQVSVHLATFPAVLAGVGRDVERDPAGSVLVLRGLQQSTLDSVDALRSITAGMLPPLLTRRGLVPAVQAHGDRSDRHPHIVVGADVGEQRFDPSVEAAAYRACVVALGAMAPRPELTIERAGAVLVARLRGSRSGELADREGLLDRVRAVGGTLTERTPRTGEAEVRVEIPVETGPVPVSPTHGGSA